MVHGTSPLQHALAILRQNVKTHAPAQRARAAAPRAPAVREPASGRYAPQASQVATLGARLAAVQRGDPQRRKKFLRLFVEAVLLDELGGGLIADPAFHDVVDRTAQAIETDPGMRATLEQALEQLEGATAAGR